MNRFQWYRRMIGGKWGIVSGLFFGKRWVHVGAECVERVEEDWRNVAHVRGNDVSTVQGIFAAALENLTDTEKVQLLLGIREHLIQTTEDKELREALNAL